MITVAVALDVYPAKVVFPDGAVMTKVRAWIVDGDLVLYVMQDGAPHEYYRRKVISTEGSSPIRGIRVQVEDGIVVVSKFGGCGCGDKLKVFNPWPGTRRATVAL